VEAPADWASLGSPETYTGYERTELLDGQPPGEAHGTDLDSRGHGTAVEQRLYQLIRQPGSVTGHTFEIAFLDPGVQAYSSIRL
jgi:Thioredoxin like C-terminal domain